MRAVGRIEAIGWRARLVDVRSIIEVGGLHVT